MSLTRTTLGLLFRDDFNRSNGALGASWTEPTTPKFLVASNIASHTTTARYDPAIARPAALATTPTGGGSLTVQWRRRRPNTNNIERVYGLYDPATGNGYAIVWNAAGNPVIVRLDSDVASPPLDSGSFNSLNNTWYTEKFICRPGVQEFWRDGVKILDATDSMYSTIDGCPAGGGDSRNGKWRCRHSGSGGNQIWGGDVWSAAPAATYSPYPYRAAPRFYAPRRRLI